MRSGRGYANGASELSCGTLLTGPAAPRAPGPATEGQRARDRDANVKLPLAVAGLLRLPVVAVGGVLGLAVLPA